MKETNKKKLMTILYILLIRSPSCNKSKECHTRVLQEVSVVSFRYIVCIRYLDLFSSHLYIYRYQIILKKYYHKEII